MTLHNNTSRIFGLHTVYSVCFQANADVSMAAVHQVLYTVMLQLWLPFCSALACSVKHSMQHRSFTTSCSIISILVPHFTFVINIWLELYLNHSMDFLIMDLNMFYKVTVALTVETQTHINICAQTQDFTFRRTGYYSLWWNISSNTWLENTQKHGHIDWEVI